MTGRVCDKSPSHGYAPDGICKWCDERDATATSCACGDTIVGGVRFPDGYTTNDGRVHAAGGCVLGQPKRHLDAVLAKHLSAAEVEQSMLDALDALVYGPLPERKP